MFYCNYITTFQVVFTSNLQSLKLLQYDNKNGTSDGTPNNPTDDGLNVLLKPLLPLSGTDAKGCHPVQGLPPSKINPSGSMYHFNQMAIKKI